MLERLGPLDLMLVRQQLPACPEGKGKLLATPSRRETEMLLRSLEQGSDHRPRPAKRLRGRVIPTGIPP